MAQLEAIRHEMRTGISIMNPGPLTSHVLENAVPGLSTAQQSPEQGARLSSALILKPNSEDQRAKLLEPLQLNSVTGLMLQQQQNHLNVHHWIMPVKLLQHR